MNIEARPLNKGAKYTKYHVPLPQEVRHQLEGVRVFSELDMGNGFDQVPLYNSSTCVFHSPIIHDNILIVGKHVEKHNTSLKATLARAKDICITLILAKTTICATEVIWFVRVYSGSVEFH